MAKTKANKSSKKSARLKPKSPANTSGERQPTERDLYDMLNSDEVESPAEINQILEMFARPFGGKMSKLSSRSAVDRAQDVMYKAWETSSPAQRIKLARQALEISPDCADAYVLLAQENAKTPAEARALYEQGVEAGERAIGKKDFKEMAGSFWGFLETRPYMRARFGLAQMLRAMGEKQQAAEHLRDMLRLNPNDNQGVRYTLSTLLLEMKADSELKNLLEQYPDDWSAVWKYNAALLVFREASKSDEANALLKEALQHNRFVPPFLLGKKKIPKQLPEFISPGKENEAIDYAVDAIPIWQQTPGARDWLKELADQNPS